MEAAGKIPGLLETLIERTRDMTRNIRNRHQEVAELASVLEALAAEAAQR